MRHSWCFRPRALDSSPVWILSSEIYLFLCSGAGWSSVSPVTAVDLQSRVAEGEFWLDETEFLSHFDDVTVGYPISDEGHLKSIYTGNSYILWEIVWNFLSPLWSPFFNLDSSSTGNLLTHSHQLAGRWMKGHCAGGSRNSSGYSSNPKFWLKVCERGEVLVSLLQHRKWRNTEKYAQTLLEDSKNTKHQHYQAIALHMWKVGDISLQEDTCLCLCVVLLIFLSVTRWRRSVLI